MDEIIRSVMALQLSYKRAIQTPANWPHNRAMLPAKDENGSLCMRECTGSVFLLPTVSKEEADRDFPNYHTCDVPSGKPYIRMVQPESVGLVQEVADASSTDFSCHQSGGLDLSGHGLGDPAVIRVARQEQEQHPTSSRKKGLSKWFKMVKNGM